ncbi:IS4 family transposase [Treponema vincentii]|uniref:IS4 family transposase n=1 Tax=Treponema vincentii TaxID=69710 RepID=UPI003D901EA8
MKSLNTSGSCRYHLGIHKELARSTLSYANNHRSCEVFERLFYALRNTLNKGGRKKLRKNLYAIDATEISLNIHDFPWALFRSTIGGIKMHTKYDINNSVPDYLFMTNAKEHENHTLSEMPLSERDTAAFDKGYCNYKNFGTFCEKGIFFVTRLKENAQYAVIESRLTDSPLIPTDETIVFTGKKTKKSCPYQLRKVVSIDEKTNKSITILTNSFDMNAADIAKLYRARWNIEIFFKTIKQNLRVKKFYGQSKNAVETQIWIALIVYVLYLKLRQMSTYEGKNFTDFISELKVCLFERQDLFRWFAGLPPVIHKSPPSCSSQQDFLL